MNITTSLKHLFKATIAILIVSLAIVFLLHAFKDISLTALATAAAATPRPHLIFALTATAISFAAMAGVEYIAASTLHKQHLQISAPILVGTVGNALANTIGLPALTLTAWRYKIYTSIGCSLRDISEITMVAFLGIVAGVAGLSIFALVFLPTSEGVAYSHLHIAGYIVLLLFGAILIWMSKSRRAIDFRGKAYRLPPLIVVLPLLFFGLVDISAAVYAAYVLLPGDMAPGFAQFSLYYIMAVVLGIISHAPGGIGVFEATLLTALAGGGRPDVLASLLIYRVIYNLLPFSLACLTLMIRAFRRTSLTAGNG